MKSKIYVGILILLCIGIAAFLLLANKRHKVDFNTMGGTIYQSQNVKSGELVNNPGIPVLEGYEFQYWIDQKTGKEFTFDTPIDHDIVLKAVYKNKETSELV